MILRRLFFYYYSSKRTGQDEHLFFSAFTLLSNQCGLATDK